MHCIICKNSEKEKLYPGIVKCSKCGLIFYDNLLNDREIKELYRDGYFNGTEYLDYKNDKKIIQINFFSHLKIITKYANKGNLLEIGSAYGFFLDLAKKHFTVEGIDIAENPVIFSREKLGLDVKNGEYLNCELNEKKDVFCMWDTIEHLSRPDKYLKKINSELNNGGYLFLTTGDIGSIMARIRGKKWRIIHPPTHLYYFSEKTMRKLLEENGFKIIKITHPGIYRSLRQILYSIFYLKKNNATDSNKIFNKLNLPIYINTFDIMMVIAKKI